MLSLDYLMGLTVINILAKTETFLQLVHNLLHADYCALVAHSLSHTGLLYSVCKIFWTHNQHKNDGTI